MPISAVPEARLVKAVEEPEDTGLEEGDDENELTESASAKASADKTSETVKGSQSQKKKSETEPEPKTNGQKSKTAPSAEERQVSLFEPPKAKSQPPQPKKEKVVQASLFGESSAEKVRARQKPKQANKKPKTNGHAPTVFTAGQTIELEL